MKQEYVSTVRASRLVDCPFSAVIEFTEAALRNRTHIVLSPAAPLAQRADVTTEISDDRSDQARKHDALLIAWRPGLALFPNFRGVLTARPEGRGASLRIEGTYEPPFGIAGRIFDAIAGRRIAALTLTRLLRALSDDVERRWQEERRLTGCRRERDSA
jgi:hypothetical protein